MVRHIDGDESQEKAMKLVLENGWEITKWQLERVNARDRLATEIIAFSGIIVAILPNLRTPLRDIANPGIRGAVLAGLLIASFGVLCAAAVSFVGVLKPPRPSPGIARLCEVQEYLDQLKSGSVDSTAVLGDLATQLIGRPGDRSPFIQLSETATRREALTRWAGLILTTSIVLIGVALVGLLWA